MTSRSWWMSTNGSASSASGSRSNRRSVSIGNSGKCTLWRWRWQQVPDERVRFVCGKRRLAFERAEGRDVQQCGVRIEPDIESRLVQCEFHVIVFGVELGDPQQKCLAERQLVARKQRRDEEHAILRGGDAN